MQGETKKWWEQAKDDLEKAAILLENKKYDGAAFFSQQAAEKALKALYLKKFNAIRKVHDLVFLSKKLNLPKDVIEKCDMLSKIYTETRYPAYDIIPAKSFTKSDGEELLNIASEVIGWIREKL